MSTCNFHKKNASRFYVISDTMEAENEEGVKETVYKSEIDFEDDTDNILYRAKKDGFEKPDNKYRDNDFDRMDGLKVADKSGFKSFCKSKERYDFVDFHFKTAIFLNSGYYSDCNLDFDIQVSCCGSWNAYNLADYDTVGEMIEDIVEDWAENAEIGWNKGFISIKKKKVEDFLRKEIEDLIDTCEEICKDCSNETYVCRGVMSNGEAIYSKVG